MLPIARNGKSAPSANSRQEIRIVAHMGHRPLNDGKLVLWLRQTGESSEKGHAKESLKILCRIQRDGSGCLVFGSELCSACYVLRNGQQRFIGIRRDNRGGQGRF